jgi:dTDP-6-deoxy-L-talose 4-dehydrogenase (NAD+)
MTDIREFTISYNTFGGYYMGGDKPGTCFEYDLSYKKLSVNTPIKPTSCYASSKSSVFFALSSFLPLNLVKFAWCRLFYLYGEGEDNRRLVPFLRSQLEKGEKINLENKNYVRDFLNVKDAAKKISKIALNKKIGAINICSGTPITIKQIAEQIADEYGRRDLLKFKKKTKKTFIPPHVLGVPNF